MHVLFQVRFTTKQRTAASAIAFVDGLFGTGMGLEFPEALDDDMLIKVVSEFSFNINIGLKIKLKWE